MTQTGGIISYLATGWHTLAAVSGFCANGCFLPHPNPLTLGEGSAPSPARGIVCASRQPALLVLAQRGLRGPLAQRERAGVRERGRCVLLQPTDIKASPARALVSICCPQVSIAVLPHPSPLPLGEGSTPPPARAFVSPPRQPDRFSQPPARLSLAQRGLRGPLAQRERNEGRAEGGISRSGQPVCPTAAHWSTGWDSRSPSP